MDVGFLIKEAMHLHERVKTALAEKLRQLAKELEEKSDRLLKVLFLVLGYTVLAGMVFIKW